jgi:hypothetical protein
VTKIRGRRKEASKLLPRLHLVASLLKRCFTGTHQGAVSHRHLPYYLDEFTFRFNRRRSKSRGKLFFRLQQAAATGPTTYSDLAMRPKLLSSESQTVELPHNGWSLWKPPGSLGRSRAQSSVADVPVPRPAERPSP